MRIPQVVADFVGEPDLQKFSSPGGQAPQEELAAYKSSWRKRVRSWLGKSSDAAWRPRKRHRTGAFKWLVNLENSLEAGVGVGGLSKWHIEDVDAEDVDATKWPLLNLVTDCGSECVSGALFLARHLRLNVDWCPDPSHGVHRDFLGSLKSARLWQHELLMMLTYNNRHGEWDGNRKFRAAKQGMASYFATFRPTECPLFMALLGGFLRDRQEDYRLNEIGVEASIWAAVRDDKLWETKGTSCNMNGFMGAMREARAEDGRWHARLLSLVFLCLEADLLKGGKLMSLLRRPLEDPPVERGPDGGEQEPKQQLNIPAQELRSAGSIGWRSVRQGGRAVSDLLA